MSQHSFGIVPYRHTPNGFDVLIGHMGGPFWARKDEGAWSFPKGLPEPGEEPLATAVREFSEETGITAPTGTFIELGDVVQSGGKTVTAWAIDCEIDVEAFEPGTFEMQWPPRSGRMQQFPEVDRIAWVSATEAKRLLVKAQAAFVDRLDERISQVG